MRELAPGQGESLCPVQPSPNCFPPVIPKEPLQGFAGYRILCQTLGVIAQPWAGRSRELTASLCL